MGKKMMRLHETGKSIPFGALDQKSEVHEKQNSKGLGWLTFKVKAPQNMAVTTGKQSTASPNLIAEPTPR